MAGRILIYGANGYTGRLIARQALEVGLKPILAGRDKIALTEMAETLDLDFRIADLADSIKLDRLLDGVNTVIHCAGPFVHTAKPMVMACLRTRTHYLDITGEVPVFDGLHQLDAEAQARGIVLLPGAGFDVVPSDCLAAYLKSRLPDAILLKLAFTGLAGGLSRGTAKTMVEHSGHGTLIRENHRLVPIPPGRRVLRVDFGEIQQNAAAISWGDVVTAHISTRIPNIEVYMGVTDAMLRAFRRSRYLSFLLRTRWMKRRLQRHIDRRPPGPSDARRAESRALLWGRAETRDGSAIEARIRAPDGYSLTAMTAVEIAGRVAGGDVAPGFTTPSQAFGSDFILEFNGCERYDVL